ncbi:hypothetical protein [Elizabethkingia phage TCUEAP3]|uniref:hypothetical protein n=1 Tax=Elizabethkingia anophelis TaxID=1117645 RepID=UPI00220D522F|nr:hypothetical protein [Elizabethkingia phage TCUEAP3]
MKDQYLTLLQLDSIYKLLTWDDRIQVQLIRQRKSDIIPQKVEELLKLLEETNWQAPEMRYLDDRLCYYLQHYQDSQIMDLKPEWLSIEFYKSFNEELTKQIVK